MSRRDTATRAATLGRLLDLYEEESDQAKRSPLAQRVASHFFKMWVNEGSVLHRPDLAGLYLRTWCVLPRQVLMRWQPDSYPLTVYRVAMVRDGDGWCWTPDITDYLLAQLTPFLPESVREYSDDQIVHTYRVIADMAHGRIFRRHLYESDIAAVYEVEAHGYVAREVIAYPTGRMPKALDLSQPLSDDSAWSVPVGHLRVGAKAWGPHETAAS